MSEEKLVAHRLRFFWFGNSIAAGISYATWHSAFWAVVHGLYGWAYVAYWVVSRYAK